MRKNEFNLTKKDDGYSLDKYKYTEVIDKEESEKVEIDVNEHEIMRDALLKIPMNKQKFPIKRSISSKVKIKKSEFNLVKDSDNGFDIKEYLPIDFKVQKNSTDAVIPSTEVTNTSEIDANEFERLTKRMFPKWGKTDNSSAISRFMYHLDPVKVYTKSDITKLAKDNGVNRVTSLMIKTYEKGGKGWGEILKKDGDKYFLFPSLVSSYKLNFLSNL